MSDNQAGFMEEMLSRMLLAGSAAGLISSFAFVIVHYLLSKPIWEILPIGMVIGIFTGLAISWSIYENFGTLSSFSLVISPVMFTVALIPAVLLAFVRGRSYTFEELMVLPTKEMLMVFLPLLITAPVTGGVIGFLFSRSYVAVFSMGLATFVVAVGIGHNIPFLINSSHAPMLIILALVPMVTFYTTFYLIIGFSAT